MHRVPSGRIVPGALLSLLLLLPGFARSQESLPDSIVLVLNVLSETHARPATGVVVSTSGQILVPASFVGRGDRIVVLSGGNSLESDAVETRTEFRSLESGIAVLAAAGLERMPVVMSNTTPGSGERLDFVAFPPAEQLAEGAPPLRRAVSAIIEDGKPSVAANPPLPAISGVLIDRCGQLAGLALAKEEPGPATGHRIVWAGELRDSLDSSGVQTEFRRCGSGAALSKDADDSSRQQASAGPQMLDTNSLEPTAPDLALSSVPTSPAGQGTGRYDAGKFDLSVSPDAVAAEPDPVATPTNDDSHSISQPGATTPGGNAERGAAMTSLQWMFLVIAFILAAAGGWWIGRRPLATPPPGPSEPAEATRPSPGTPAPGDSDNSSVDLQLGFDVTYSDGSSRKHACRLHAGHGQALIGRGQVELVIADASLARVHGRIQVIDGMLVYSDTGSERGSWVNGVACLEGEQFELEPGATLILGAVHLVLETVQAGERADP